MKKILLVLVSLLMVMSLVACSATPAPAASVSATPAAAAKAIKVGIVNNPPSESGYRAANVADFEKVFTEAKGYKVSTVYSLKNDEQLNAASQFITDGVDYLLISAAATDGWDTVLNKAKEAGIKVFLFDRMMKADESLYEGDSH